MRKDNNLELHLSTEGFKSKGTEAAFIGANQRFRSNQVQVQPTLEPTHTHTPSEK
jgi:hypothetical protein